MSMVAAAYPSSEYIVRALHLDTPEGFAIALCFFVLVVGLALTVGTRRLNRKRANR